MLKLIGDGVLAIFRAEDRGQACRSAIAAAMATRASLYALNRRRIAENLPNTHIYLGLHVGEVFFGNIGSKDRLDFTVIGPSVNEASRIEPLTKSLGYPVLMTEAFAKLCRPQEIRSLGFHVLRGVREPREIFTLAE